MPPARSRSTPRPGRPKDLQLAQQRRDQIIQAAIPLFAQHGFTGADVEAIAAGLGCAKGTIYNYFKNKKDLFHHCVDFVMRGLLQATSTDPQLEAVSTLKAAIAGYLGYFHEHPEYVELLILERAVFRDRKKATYFVYRDVQIERWRTIWQQLIDQGRVRNVPVNRILDTIGDLLYGTIFTNYFATRDKPLHDQVADVLDLVLHSLLTPAELRRHARNASK